MVAETILRLTASRARGWSCSIAAQWEVESPLQKHVVNVIAGIFAVFFRVAVGRFELRVGAWATKQKNIIKFFDSKKFTIIEPVDNI